MKAKEIIGEGVLGGIGKVLQKVGGKMVDKSAAKAVEPVASKAPGIAKKVGGAIIRNPVKSTIGAATAYNLATDPDLGKKDIPTAVGDALGRTYKQGKKLAGAAWDSATRDDDTAVATTPGSGQSGKPSSSQSEKEFSSDVDHPVAAPEPDSGNYVQDMERRIQKNFDRWPGQQNESIKKKFAIAEKSKEEKEDPLAAIQRGIYGQESGYGKAKTDRPNYAGATGPMQIMPGTFDWLKSLKLIPQDYDIRNPKHNKEAGNALIAHYYKKYQGDPAKVAAAYYGGPGAINKDGTINTHWKDKKNPKAPTVGEYINQTLAKANLPAVAGTTALAGVPKGSGAKPSSGADVEKVIQMPDFSKGYKVNDKFVPLTDKGRGEPTDYTQAYTKAKQSMGYSPDEMLRQANAELLAKRSGTITKPEPTPVVSKAAVTPEPSTKSVVPSKSKDDKETGSWDKIKTSNVPLEEQQPITEHINKEIQDILRLSGKR